MATATVLPPSATPALTAAIPPEPGASPSSTSEPTSAASATAAASATTAVEPTLAGPTDTPAPASPSEPAGTTVPTELPAPGASPTAAGVTFQIMNSTDKIVYVAGYGVNRAIPSGMTIYYQAPAWGEISLTICHRNKFGERGGCYVYTGEISPSRPVVEVTR